MDKVHKYNSINPTNLARNFEVMSGKFNVMGICTRENHAQKHITKMHT
jgi:hypothetical protein